MLFKTSRKFNLRHLNTIKTISLLALLAIEVGVQIVIMIIVMTMAELIACTVASSLYGMYKMMFAE